MAGMQQCNSAQCISYKAAISACVKCPMKSELLELQVFLAKLLSNRVAAIFKAVARNQGVLLTPLAMKSEVSDEFKLAAVCFSSGRWETP